MADPADPRNTPRGDRLLMVASEFPPGPGGIGTHAHEIAGGLARLGWDVSVLAPQDYSTDEEARAFVSGASYRFFRLERASTTWRRATQWWRQCGETFDGVHPALVLLSGVGPSLFAYRHARKRRVPCVVVLHGTDTGAGRGPRSRLFARVVRSADGVIAVSRFTGGMAQARGVKADRIAVVPNGADHCRFHPGVVPAAWKRAQGLADGDRILLTVGRVCNRKGQELVVRALARVVARASAARYVMAGIPERGEDLLRLAAELGVSDAVRLAGPVPAGDLPVWYRAADLLVLPSRPTSSGDVEGYGIVVIEAALCGTPAVVSDHGGLPEAVVDGSTGWVTPCGDVGALAETLGAALEDRKEIARRGEAARLRAGAEGTWAARVRQYDRVLRPFLDAESGG